jgi:hypothetical protein
VLLSALFKNVTLGCVGKIIISEHYTLKAGKMMEK